MEYRGQEFGLEFGLSCQLDIYVEMLKRKLSV